MKTILKIIMGSALVLALTLNVFAQTNIQFTSVNVTPENAIQLHWTSTNHEIYGIQYANALGTNADGTTAWFSLFDHYPSHGTNTFIGDFGNYDVIPAIPHPKYMPMRFYRVVDEGADNDTTDNPSITITGPTNGAVLSDQITVSVVATCSNLPVVTTKLYVDGQEMDESDDGTNYLINTCEWANGSHVLFAVATARSGFSGPSGNFPVSTSHSVSSYIPVTFNNLVSRIAFSQPFFEPSLGQTQEVTASFAANCNWTLQIQDVNTNTVRNASGSGSSMTFDWDGTGDGGTNIPDGIYHYLITATTNGMAPMSMLTSPAPVSTKKQLWVLEPDGFVPLAIFPKGIDTNGFTIIKATESQVEALTEAATPEVATSISSFTPSFTSMSLPSSQPSTAPTRPPTAPIKNAVNTYGIAYYSWPSSQTVAIPKNGITFPATGVCHLDGDTTNTLVEFDNIPEASGMEVNMIRVLSKAGWKIQYDRADDTLYVNDMRRSDLGYGGGELFTTATLGLFLDHGDYGTDPDYNPGSSGSKETYFRSDNDSGDNGWLRMCQIGFGGSLKWMGILACNSLNTYTSMKNAGAIPLKTTHLVCGTSTIAGVGEDIGAYWAKNIMGGVFSSPETIANAWFDAGHKEYIGATNLPTVIFRVAGYPECISDTVNSNTAPTSPSSAPGNLTKIDQQVFP
jgi:FlgD Ig-like domain/Bacterial Ig domain